MNFNQLLGLDIKHVQKEAMLDDLGSISHKVVEMLDGDLDERALTHAIYDMRAKALAVVLVLANDILEGELDADETPAERLDVLVSHYVDDEEDIVLSAFYANMQDAMVSLGVPESIAEEALYADDEQLRDEAVESLSDLVNSNVPDDDDFDEWQQEFIYSNADEHFGDDGEAEQLDGLTQHNKNYHKKANTVGKTTTKETKRGTIIYKAVKAIRNGELAVVNKRIGGNYRPTQKQRAAMKKLSKFAKTKKAITKRLKSLRLGKKMGLYS